MKFGFQLASASGRDYLFLTEIKSPDLLKFLEKELRDDAEAIRYEIREGQLFLDRQKKVFQGALNWMSIPDYIQLKRMKNKDFEGVVKGLHYLSPADEKATKCRRYFVLGINAAIASICIAYTPVFFSMLMGVFRFIASYFPH